MYRCVHCGADIESICARYGDGPLLHCPLPCPQCRARIADPYIERDAVLLFLDAVLHKPAVYRHLLFNRWPRGPEHFALKLLLVFLVMDMWANTPNDLALGIAKALLKTIVYLSTVSLLFHPFVTTTPRKPSSSWLDHVLIVQAALILSSFAKGLYLLMAVWQYGRDLEYVWLVRIFVFTSNAEALLALLQPGCSRTHLSLLYLLCYGSVTIGHVVVTAVTNQILAG